MIRIDVFSIFPGYFDALDLSLAGKARDSGLLELATDGVELERFKLALVEDLRDRAPPERARLLGSLEQLLPLFLR